MWQKSKLQDARTLTPALSQGEREERIALFGLSMTHGKGPPVSARRFRVRATIANSAGLAVTPNRQEGANALSRLIVLEPCCCTSGNGFLPSDQLRVPMPPTCSLSLRERVRVRVRPLTNSALWLAGLTLQKPALSGCVEGSIENSRTRSQNRNCAWLQPSPTSNLAQIRNVL